MDIIPAIDLHGGKCVRLLRGERSKETVYSDNPAEMARKWQSLGAARLHMVDLDGAFAGKRVNAAAISDVVSALSIPVQLGGGIRDREIAQSTLDLGVSKIILGTAAIRKPELIRELVEAFGKRILVGIDAREGMVAVEGWMESSTSRAVDLALQMQEFGVSEIIYTDIARDGTLEGPNLTALQEMAGFLSIPLIASGGVSSLDDLKRLRELEHLGISGVIVGQALYTGKFGLEEAIEVIKG
ncbi:MAG TPA: 1-(5-phosphoribosyl)-5-[(5-phosphoribosylamino)methylideneamino]imidazole-4-carboxamide isomerase [Firmicutes bacterium]|nr:1-(5-phosphoribosyl)-5-[(5-phosphoribosylamino)methylideneamino]imidazole-4-carboxamide isomerase [Bacillota bacterium]